MITVSIMINGKPIFTRSAVRIKEPDANGNATYKVDDGTIIKHGPDDGAVALSKKLLNLIDEV